MSANGRVIFGSTVTVLNPTVMKSQRTESSATMKQILSKI